MEFTWELLVQLALVRISMLLRTKWTLSNLAPASVGCIAPEVVSDRATPSSKTRPTPAGTKRSSLIFFLPKPTKNLILARLIFLFVLFLQSRLRSSRSGFRFVSPFAGSGLPREILLIVILRVLLPLPLHMSSSCRQATESLRVRS